MESIKKNEKSPRLVPTAKATTKRKRPTLPQDATEDIIADGLADSKPEMTTAELEACAREYDALRRQQNAIALQLDEVAARIKQEMARRGIPSLIVGPHRITFKVVQEKRIDTTELREKSPQTAKKYEKTTLAQRFKIN